jgi:hypothetical protein
MTAPARTGGRGRIVAEPDRVTGDLTPGEVRQVVHDYLAAWEVAQLARTILHSRHTGHTMAHIRAGQRGYAGGGTTYTTTAKGVQVRLADPGAPAGYRGGVIRWRLLLQVIADGATPARLTELTRALREHDHVSARQAAAAIVLTGPPATQLDLLGTLDQPEDTASRDPGRGSRRTGSVAARPPRRRGGGS